jgi:hypothetical protein
MTDTTVDGSASTAHDLAAQADAAPAAQADAPPAAVTSAGSAGAKAGLAFCGADAELAAVKAGSGSAIPLQGNQSIVPASSFLPGDGEPCIDNREIDAVDAPPQSAINTSLVADDLKSTWQWEPLSWGERPPSGAPPEPGSARGRLAAADRAEKVAMREYFNAKNALNLELEKPQHDSGVLEALQRQIDNTEVKYRDARVSGDMIKSALYEAEAKAANAGVNGKDDPNVSWLRYRLQSLQDPDHARYQKLWDNLGLDI